MRPHDQLEFFVAKVRELQSTRLLQQEFGFEFTVSWQRMEALRFEMRQPEEDHLRAFLLGFRQFVAPGEPICLNAIYNLCHRVIDSQELKGYLIEARSAWKNAFKKGGFNLVVDDRTITPEGIYDLWINGHYFHADIEKRRELERLIGPEAIFTRGLFLDLLVEATRQLLYTGNVVVAALREGLVRDGSDA
jgi:hypothetical protein